MWPTLFFHCLSNQTSVRRLSLTDTFKYCNKTNTHTHTQGKCCYSCYHSYTVSKSKCNGCHNVKETAQQTFVALFNITKQTFTDVEEHKLLKHKDTCHIFQIFSRYILISS